MILVYVWELRSLNIHIYFIVQLFLKSSKVFIQPPTMKDLTQGHFSVGSHARIETRAWLSQ